MATQIFGQPVGIPVRVLQQPAGLPGLYRPPGSLRAIRKGPQLGVSALRAASSRQGSKIQAGTDRYKEAGTMYEQPYNQIRAENSVIWADY